MIQRARNEPAAARDELLLALRLCKECEKRTRTRDINAS